MYRFFYPETCHLFSIFEVQNQEKPYSMYFNLKQKAIGFWE